MVKPHGGLGEKGMGTAQSKRKGGKEEKKKRREGGWNRVSSTRVARPKLQIPNADSCVLTANWALPLPPNDSTSSHLSFPPKLDGDGSPFHGEPTSSSLASPRAPTVFFAVSEATTTDHHHGSTPNEPRNMPQALVGATEHRRWRIEATQISRVPAGFE